jgi:hypothetical protein
MCAGTNENRLGPSKPINIKSAVAAFVRVNRYFSGEEGAEESFARIFLDRLQETEGLVLVLKSECKM